MNWNDIGLILTRSREVKALTVEALSFYTHVELRAVLGLFKLTLKIVISRSWEVGWSFNNLCSFRVSYRFASKIVSPRVIWIFRVVSLGSQRLSGLLKLLSWT